MSTLGAGRPILLDLEHTRSGSCSLCSHRRGDITYSQWKVPMIIKKTRYPDASGYRESWYPDASGYRESWYPDASGYRQNMVP